MPLVCIQTARLTSGQPVNSSAAAPRVILGARWERQATPKCAEMRLLEPFLGG